MFGYNKLLINVQKTNYVIFSPSQSSIQWHQTYLCLQMIHFRSWVAHSHFDFSWKMSGMTEPEVIFIYIPIGNISRVV